MQSAWFFAAVRRGWRCRRGQFWALLRWLLDHAVNPRALRRACVCVHACLIFSAVLLAGELPLLRCFCSGRCVCGTDVPAVGGAGSFFAVYLVAYCDTSAMVCVSEGRPRVMRRVVCGPHGALWPQLRVAVRAAGGRPDVLPGCGGSRGGRAGARCVTTQSAAGGMVAGVRVVGFVLNTRGKTTINVDTFSLCFTAAPLLSLPVRAVCVYDAAARYAVPTHVREKRRLDRWRAASPPLLFR
ncbi:hypothetical protein MOQ_007446, partial [Trypanosoma cruzi marinkellei]